MIFSLVLNRGGRGLLSPVDRQLNSIQCEKSAYTAKIVVFVRYLGSLKHTKQKQGGVMPMIVDR